MPFRLKKPFAPSYTIGKPDEDADGVAVKLCEWDTGASVEITNEPGKRFKVGFVQILLENVIIATYQTRIMERTCSPLPVLDSSPGMYPFYETDTNYSPEVDGTAGSVTADARIYDEPEDPFDWYETPANTNPLIELKYRLKFKTWLVVRDITTIPYPESFAAVLTQFNLGLEVSFNVNVAAAVGKRCQLTIGRSGLNRPETVWPPTPIHKCIWTDRVANDCLNDVWTDRHLIVGSYAPVGPVNTGVNVQQLGGQIGQQGPQVQKAPVHTGVNVKGLAGNFNK